MSAWIHLARIWPSRCFFATFLAFGLSVTDVLDANAEDIKSNPRLSSVYQLIEHSSAARRVKESGNPEAIERRESALDLVQQAEQALEEGDSEQAGALTREAAQVFVAAVKLLDQGKVAGARQSSDFTARRESIVSLVDAHGRVAQEKGLTSEHEVLQREVLAKLSAADMASAEGDQVAASAQLQEAYMLVKSAVGNLRDGDTLVRSLHFATAEEEFLYEIDRNDTHRMLVTMLLDEKPTQTEVRKKTESLIKEAGKLRKQAEELGAQNRYPEAITMLEKSTLQLVLAIRAAGIYIPS